MIYKKIIKNDYDFNDLYKDNDPHKYIPLGGVDSEYLFFHNKSDYDDSDFIVKTIKKYSSKYDIKTCYSELRNYFNKNIDHILINSMDEVNKKLVDIKEKIKPEFIYELGKKIIHTTKNIELFKLGIYLLGVVIIDEKDKSDLLQIALCDEFTFYCLYYHFLVYEKANDLVFYLSQKVNGWGKIYCIQEIKVVNDNIRTYLVNDGFKNDINNSYSANAVVSKVNIVDYLNKKNISKKEFINISKLIEAIFNDPFGLSINSINNPLLLFGRYFKLFKKGYKDYRSYYAISLINIYLHDVIREEGLLKSEINKFINSKDMKNALIEHIKNCNGEILKNILYVLVSYNLDLAKYVFNKYKSNPKQYYYAIEYLMKYSRYKNKTIKLLEDNYKFDFEEAVPVIRVNYDYDFSLIQILRDLRPYPFMGEIFIKAGINNSNYYVRKEAILTIYEWYRDGDRDLKDCSFYDDLINLSEIETIKELRGSLNELFDREENLDYLDNIKIDVVDASKWVKIYDLDIKDMFDDKTITKAKKLKIDKRGKVDNYYKYDIDDKTVIINISVDNKIKWFNCSCGNDKCSHLCKCLIDLSGKEV